MNDIKGDARTEMAVWKKDGGISQCPLAVYWGDRDTMTKAWVLNVRGSFFPSKRMRAI
jgi:hypothetical protein